MSDCVRPDLKDATNKKVLGKFKDELNGYIFKELTGLNPKVYSKIHQHFDKATDISTENKNTKTFKGASKAVVKNQITHQDYVDVWKTNKPLTREVIGVRNLNHQLYTYKQDTVDLTSYYDKRFMSDGTACTPYGYYKNKNSQ